MDATPKPVTKAIVFRLFVFFICMQVYQIYFRVLTEGIEIHKESRERRLH